jgi:hypothetical protein
MGFFGIPVAAVIAMAGLIAVMAVYENVRFSRGADQILNLMAANRYLASLQGGFAATAGDDAIGLLEKSAQLAPGKDRSNPWDGTIRAVTLGANQVRIETAMPPRSCRRMAIYLLQHNPDQLGVTVLEAREQGGVWRRFYAAPGDAEASQKLVTMSCGQGAFVDLGFVFRVR